jgi:hypothetical protein
MKLKMRLAVAALLTIGLSSAAAYADTVTFTLTNPVKGIFAATQERRMSPRLPLPATQGPSS